MIFSRGWPCFSYIASMKKGSMTSIMHMAATLLPAGPPEQKEKRHADERPAAEADKLPLG